MPAIRLLASPVVQDACVAGAAGAVGSALPSTLWTALRREDLLAGACAVGSMLLPGERRSAVLLAASVPVHAGLSLGWAAVLAATLPARREPAWGVAGGLAIAALDLVVIGRRIPPIAELPQGRQWADHVAYGLVVGLVLRRRRARRRAPASAGAARAAPADARVTEPWR